jgi:hypothetical protein
MKRKLFFAVPLLLLVTIAAAMPHRLTDRRDVTVHEWGTFTSVAGEDGAAIPWRTDRNADDLPCFVGSAGVPKFRILSSVRMETPVLYFYASREAVADVHVQFPGGTITEWYPSQTPGGKAAIAWNGVHILPHAAVRFPTESGSSHYYAARETDAAPLQVGGQNEKFLFYRGVGQFPLPVSARTTSDGRVVLRTLNGNVIDGAILFENRAGQRRFAFVGAVNGEVVIDCNSLQDNWSGLLGKLERVLTDHGLYPKEAHAMVETWRDSWFEDGSRLLYIVPRAVVDSVLPLDIRPLPQETSRVFVGRMELITPEIQSDVRQALARNDRAGLSKYGRFLEPIADRIRAKSPLLDSIYDTTENRRCRR